MVDHGPIRGWSAVGKSLAPLPSYVETSPSKELVG